MNGGLIVAAKLAVYALVEIPWFSLPERRAPRRLGYVVRRTEAVRDSRAPPGGN